MDRGEELDEYRAVERELCRIPDVTAARIVADASGRPTEVHILASPAKNAKQIVRDVQSVAMASFGLEFDRRIISVVQLDSAALEDVVASDDRRAADVATPAAVTAAPAATTAAPAPATSTPPPDPARPPSARIVVDGVTALRDGTRCSAQVSLRRDDDVAVGVSEGLSVSGAELRLVASATLAALRELEPAATRADVEVASLVRLGDRQVAVASVVFVVPPYEEVVTGSAVVRSAGENDAMVRAVLDATNRRLAQLAGS